MTLARIPGPIGSLFRGVQVYHAPLGGILGVQRYATDAQGHEHVESGPAGGQFTSKGGGGGKAEGGAESKGKPEPKAEADKPEAPRSHKDAYRDLIAKAKETRRAAWNEARAKAKESDEAANKAAAGAWQSISHLSWESDNDWFDSYRELEELVGDYDPDETVENRMTSLKEIGMVAKEAMKVKADEDDDDPDRVTAEHIAENRPHLEAIVAAAKAGRDHLRAYVAARREVQTIKSGKWQQYAAVLGGMLTSP